MPYEITATRKRPQGFDELAGQEFVSATLEASLESGRIAHAYLFSGPRGCGKTSTARILAKALNCEKGPTAKPCGVCSSCRSITAGSSLDVIEIDGASNTSVDNVRQIKDEVLFPPNGGKYKVYIIDEVHMLSNSAFNALLKTIEEPPPYIVFIFATTELHKVPATIKSRCQQFAFRLIPLDVVKGLLAKAAAEMGVEVEDEALLWIAKESGGSQRDAYTLFDQVVSFSEGKMTAKLIRDKLGLVGLDGLNALFERAVEGDAPGALSVLDTILERGVSPEQCVVDTVEYVRSLLLLKSGIERESLLGAAPSAYSRVVLDSLTRERIERALAGLLDLHRAIRFSVNPRFEIELAVSRLSRLADYVSPAELAVAVAGLRRYLAGEGPLPCVVDSGLARHGVSGASAGAQASTERPLGAVSSGSTSTQVTRSTQAEQADQGAEKKKPEPPASSRLPPHLMAAFSSLAAATEAEAVGDSGAERKAVENVNPNKAGKAGSGNAGMTFAEQRKPSIQASSAPIAATSVSGIEALPSLAAGTTATGAIAAMSDSAIFVPPRPQAQTPRASIAGIAPPPSRDDDETALEEDEASSSAEDDLWAASPEAEVGAAATGATALGAASESREATSISDHVPEVEAEGLLGVGDLRAAVLEKVVRSSPLLASGLSASLPWRLEEGRLVIPFGNGMQENVVRAELAALSRAVGDATGTAVKVELKIETSERSRRGASESDRSDNDPVSLVERVFRGRRAETKKNGGGDELR